MLVVEDCAEMKALSILVRGGSEMIVAEASRSLHDSLCVVRNLIKCNKVVYGGGSCELACAIAL